MRSTLKNSMKLEMDPVPLKIMLVGDGMVGKSAICKSYMKRSPYLMYQPTISETHEVIVSIQKKDFSVVLWDTAGVEEWDRLRIKDYTNIDCFILCYAVNNRTSYSNIETRWVPELRQHCPSVPILLVGTKTDFRTCSDRLISSEEGNQLKEKVKVNGFTECSAKSVASIEGVFIQAVSIAENYRQVKRSSSGFRFSRCIIL